MTTNVRMFDERFWEPDEILWNTLFQHRDHHIEIGVYGDKDDPDDICVECLDCNRVLIDAGIYTVCAREDGLK